MMPGYSPPANLSSTHMRQFGQDESNFQHSQQGGGFSFRKRHGRIDWRRLAVVDVERVARDIDVQTLQNNIAHIAFCDVENELNLKDADANLVKLFKLAQLLIEYLLHSQEYLQGYISQIETQIQKAVQEQTGLSAEIEKKNGAYRSLKKEYQKSKKLIGEYQLMLRAGASGFHQCPFCKKSFLNDEFLKAHILRRHSEQAQQTQINGASIQRGFIDVTGTGQQNVSANNDELLKELSHITMKLQETEARLVAEREERDRKNEAERETDFKKIQDFSRSELAAKDEEIANMKVLIQSHKDMFLKEINQLFAEKDSMQKQFDNLKESQGTRPSMLGNLQDVTGESPHEVDITQMKEQLQKELTASYQEQMDKITRASKRREDQMKKTHTEELEKFSSLLTKYEESIKKAELEKSQMATRINKEQQLNNDKFQRYEQMMDEQQMQLSKMEELLNTKRSKVLADEETLMEASMPQDAVFASTPMVKRSFEEPKETQLNDESLVLYVASNSKNNFRVWKSSSPSSSEWKDTFNFKAFSREDGPFSTPIYVYYASGSPYWRQYVSSSSVPPRSSYKLDFVFYVSSVSLMGTMKLFVLNAGSGEVVKSMISKSEIYPGWKQKGLSFFATKVPTGQGLTKSVSFQSTLNESEFDSGDEVSVSSYAGTEDAKKSLAAAIARSREDLFVPEKEEDLRVEQKEEEKFAEEDEIEDDEEDITVDESDGKLGTMGSTSQWGSTLLQTGQFLPFPKNPLAVARYNHTKEMIDSCREEAIEILNMNLEKRGIDPDITGITNEQYDSKMKLHENEVKTKTRKRPDEVTKRKRLLEDVDKLARELLGITDEPKTAEKSKSKFKHAVNKIKNASIFGRTSPRKKDDKQNSKDSNSRPASFINESFDEPPSPKMQRLSKSNQSIEELRPVPEPKSILKHERESDNNDEVFDELSENSRLDSEGSSYGSPSPPGGTAQLPKVTVTKPGISDEPATRSISMREPKGEKVRDLAASLEARLFAREGIKKPTGAVDLHDTLQSVPDEPRQDSKAHQFKFDVDDDDDFDDDFGLSSLEEEDFQDISPSKKPAVGSSFGSSKPLHLSGSSSKLQTNQTAISKFSADDDFDNDSDLGL